MIERRIDEFHYYVNERKASGIYLEPQTLLRLKEDGCDLSITAISHYLREKSTMYRPILLTWNMTSKCNFDCPFCYIRDNIDCSEISFEDAKDVIDNLVEEGLFEVYLSGGECLIVKDFERIYRYLKEKGIFVTIFTNGSLIGEKILECWKEFPPSSVEITLYNDDFNSAPFVNLLKLKEMGIFVLPKFTLTSTTLEYYEQVKKWIEDHGMILVADANITDGVDEKHSNIENKFALSDDLKKKYTPYKYKEANRKSTVRIGFPCKSKKGIVHIDSRFEMSICNKMKIRWNLKEKNTHVAMKELRALINKYENSRLNGCNGCEYSKHCNMCFVNAQCVDGQLYVPQGHCEAIKIRWANLLED